MEMYNLTIIFYRNRFGRNTPLSRLIIQLIELTCCLFVYSIEFTPFHYLSVEYSPNFKGTSKPMSFRSLELIQAPRPLVSSNMPQLSLTSLQSSNVTLSIYSIPPTALINILTFLDLGTVMNLASTNRYFRKLIQSASLVDALYWQPLFDIHFPHKPYPQKLLDNDERYDELLLKLNEEAEDFFYSNAIAITSGSPNPSNLYITPQSWHSSTHTNVKNNHTWFKHFRITYVETYSSLVSYRTLRSLRHKGVAHINSASLVTCLVSVLMTVFIMKWAPSSSTHQHQHHGHIGGEYGLIQHVVDQNRPAMLDLSSSTTHNQTHNHDYNYNHETVTVPSQRTASDHHDRHEVEDLFSTTSPSFLALKVSITSSSSSSSITKASDSQVDIDEDEIDTIPNTNLSIEGMGHSDTHVDVEAGQHTRPLHVHLSHKHHTPSSFTLVNILVFFNILTTAMVLVSMLARRVSWDVRQAKLLQDNIDDIPGWPVQHGLKNSDDDGDNDDDMNGVKHVRRNSARHSKPHTKTDRLRKSIFRNYLFQDDIFVIPDAMRWIASVVSAAISLLWLFITCVLVDLCVSFIDYCQIYAHISTNTSTDVDADIPHHLSLSSAFLFPHLTALPAVPALLCLVLLGLVPATMLSWASLVSLSQRIYLNILGPAHSYTVNVHYIMNYKHTLNGLTYEQNNETKVNAYTFGSNNVFSYDQKYLLLSILQNTKGMFWFFPRIPIQYVYTKEELQNLPFSVLSEVDPSLDYDDEDDVGVNENTFPQQPTMSTKTTNWNNPSLSYNNNNNDSRVNDCGLNLDDTFDAEVNTSHYNYPEHESDVHLSSKALLSPTSTQQHNHNNTSSHSHGGTWALDGDINASTTDTHSHSRAPVYSPSASKTGFYSLLSPPRSVSADRTALDQGGRSQPQSPTNHTRETQLFIDSPSPRASNKSTPAGYQGLLSSAYYNYITLPYQQLLHSNRIAFLFSTVLLCLCVYSLLYSSPTIRHVFLLPIILIFPKVEKSTTLQLLWFLFLALKMCLKLAGTIICLIEYSSTSPNAEFSCVSKLCFKIAPCLERCLNPQARGWLLCRYWLWERWMGVGINKKGTVVHNSPIWSNQALFLDCLAVIMPFLLMFPLSLSQEVHAHTESLCTHTLALAFVSIFVSCFPFTLWSAYLRIYEGDQLWWASAFFVPALSSFLSLLQLMVPIVMGKKQPLLVVTCLVVFPTLFSIAVGGVMWLISLYKLRSIACKARIEAPGIAKMAGKHRGHRELREYMMTPPHKKRLSCIDLNTH